ncbi:nuclear autoantigenic sperm protein [Danio rerio]|uniref:Nuclear autoantigenic sperm protein n=1 Tax=Danio rerio TaxID=7955 RepID=F1QNE0_DANRE|nr:nuclear autoantigenic sperm protein [Danio rerio]|eukprot:NP_956076.2 nuclear autoantigenic sperm protein [Danio rerio]
MPEETGATSTAERMEEKPCSSSTGDSSVDVAEEAKKLIGTGSRHLVMGDVVSAVSVFQEACAMLAEKYGDTADECGEAFFFCGKALLELARMENTVLGNALEGVPEESSEEGEKQDDSKIESADNLDEKTRDELRAQVYDAMSEDNTRSEVEKEECGEGERNNKEEDEKQVKVDEAPKEADTASKTEKPTEDEAKPAENQEKMAVDEEKPAEKQEKMAVDEAKPAENEKLAKDEAKPEEKLAEEETKQAEDEAKPAENEERPAEDKAKPASIEKCGNEDEKSKGEDEDASTNKDVTVSNGIAEKNKDESVEEKKGSEDTEEPMEEDGGDDDGDEDEDDDEDAEGDAKDKESEEDEVGNLQLAWEMLEVAKVIYKRKDDKEDQLMAAQIHLKLAEVGVESGNYSQALEDFNECLTLQLKHLPSHSRLLAETHYQLGTTYSYTTQYNQAIEHFSNSIKVIESRLAMLQEVIDKAEGEDSAKEEKGEFEELKQLLPEIKEKIEDAKESQRTAAAASEAIHQTLAGASTSSAFPTENGGPSSSTASQIAVRPADGASSSKSASDISHLVRKKRKPDEESPKKDSDAKKTKQDTSVNGSDDSAHNGNGVQEKMEQEPANSSSVETSA